MQTHTHTTHMHLCANLTAANFLFFSRRKFSEIAQYLCSMKAFNFSPNRERVCVCVLLNGVLSLPKIEFHNVSWKLILFRVRNSTNNEKNCHLLLITNSFATPPIYVCIIITEQERKRKNENISNDFLKGVAVKCVFFLLFRLLSHGIFLISKMKEK